MGDGSATLQLYYNPGFTALSSFIPTIALFVALTIADRRHRGPKTLFVSLCCSGVLAGMAIVGMHYAGMAGITNYSISFNPHYVGGAILIAAVACVLALTLIFILQDRWISILPYRIMVALILSSGVCAMHYTATMGTIYSLKNLRDDRSQARNTSVIIATVLSLMTIPVCFAIAYSTSRRQKKLADKAQQVILACARFDTEGKLMVTVEGLLPCQSVTVHENERCFEDEFNVTHPAFQWIYQVSHNWTSISKWVPKMRLYLRAINFLANPVKLAHLNDSASVLDYDIASKSEDYSRIFRQSFCVAAADLANDFKEPLSDIGTLYDGVMMTGTLAAGGIHRQRSIMGRLSGTPSSLVKDLEANVGVDVFGKGQLLFLVQQCEPKDVARLTAEGYRFVSIEKVETHLSRAMQVPSPYLNSYLHSLQAYAGAEKQVNIASGTLLGCFILRAGLQKRSWDVVVQRDVPYRIPSVQLSPMILDNAISGVLGQFDGLSVTNCLARLDLNLEAPEDSHVEFWKLLREKIIELQHHIDEPFFRNALFSSRITKIPTWDEHTNSLTVASMLTFIVIPDVHQSSLKSSPHLEYVPFSFLKCRQRVLEGGLCKVNFESKTQHEFASIFARKGSHGTNSRSTTSTTKRMRSLSETKPPFSDVVPLNWFSSFHSARNASKVASLRSLTSRNHPGSMEAENIAMQMPYGGIMVSSDVTVETSPKEPDGMVSEFPDDSNGTRAYADHGEMERETYIDYLYATAVSKWTRI